MVLGGPYYGPVGDPIGNPIFYFGGGGIENFGTLTVNQCTVSGNNISLGGGGIENFWHADPIKLHRRGEYRVWTFIIVILLILFPVV